MLGICFQMAINLKWCKRLFVHSETYMCSAEMKKGGQGIRNPSRLLRLTEHLPPPPPFFIILTSMEKSSDLRLEAQRQCPKPMASGCVLMC